MNSIKTPIIIFALVLLLLVGGVILLGNPEGTEENASQSILKEVLSTLQINEDDLNSCVESGEFQDRVRKDMNQATSKGITGTPGVYILDQQTGLSVYAGGAYPFEPLSESIKGLLSGELNEGDIAYENNDVGITLQVKKVDDIGLVEEDHLRGNPDARLVLIEFSDLDCQYCASFHGVALQLLNEYPEDLVWAFRHFPLTSIHPTSMRKSLTVECLGKLGGREAFWAGVDTYYLNLISQQ